MANIAEVRDRTERHAMGLVMHWMDECADPTAHKIAGGSTVAANTHNHVDRLAAVWSKESPTPPRTDH